MQAKKCRHCGTLNNYTSHFCEGCGKRLPAGRGGSGDSTMLAIIGFVLIAAGGVAWYLGYRPADLMKFVSHFMK